MYRDFRAKSIFALALGGIALLATPAMTLGQSVSSESNILQQPATPDTASDTDQFAQASQAPSGPAPKTGAPNSTVPNSGAPKSGTLAQGIFPAMSGLGSANSFTPQFSLASTPNMIGDLLGGGYNLGSGGNGGSLSLAGGDRRTKISEDSSPLPTDRVFFDYNDFKSAALTIDGRIIDVNRYTFGLEKTFFDGAASIEVRVPIENGLAPNETDPAGANGNEGTSLGNISITPKYLFAKSDTWAASAGVTIGLPTAPDASTSIFATRIRNESVHLEPFLGLLSAPTDRLFANCYVQFDFDTNGDPVTTQFGGPSVSFDGRLRDPTLLYADVSVGYWLYDRREGSRNYWGLGGYVSGVAPIIEMHYTTALQDFSENVFPITSEFAREDILNLTAGLDFQLGPLSSLVVAAAVPLRTTVRDKEFDSEVIVQLDRRF
jgi:hypothetical protein